MAEQKDRLEAAFAPFSPAFRARSKARFEQIAGPALTMKPNPAAKLLCLIRGHGHAGIDGRLIAGWGFSENEPASKCDLIRLFAAGAGQQSAHAKAARQAMNEQGGRQAVDETS
jgi:hypothetical protein